MQRWNCVALFAALAIGFGAVQAQAAAKVKSVTVTMPADSGDVVGIEQTIRVEAVVEDFTPRPDDAIIFYLVRLSEGTPDQRFGCGRRNPEEPRGGRL